MSDREEKTGTCKIIDSRYLTYFQTLWLQTYDEVALPLSEVREAVVCPRRPRAEGHRFGPSDHTRRCCRANGMLCRTVTSCLLRVASGGSRTYKRQPL